MHLFLIWHGKCQSRHVRSATGSSLETPETLTRLHPPTSETRQTSARSKVLQLVKPVLTQGSSAANANAAGNVAAANLSRLVAVQNGLLVLLSDGVDLGPAVVQLALVLECRCSGVIFGMSASGQGF